MHSIVTNHYTPDEFWTKVQEVVSACVKSSVTLMPQREIIDDPTLCMRLDITRQTSKTWREKKKLPFFKIGASVRYDWNKVIDFLEKNSAK